MATTARRRRRRFTLKGGPRNLTLYLETNRSSVPLAVQKILGGGKYSIMLDNERTITAQLSGRMRRFRIRVIPGDRVQVGVSPYDPTHGFITYREPPGSRPSGS